MIVFYGIFVTDLEDFVEKVVQQCFDTDIFCHFTFYRNVFKKQKLSEEEDDDEEEEQTLVKVREEIRRGTTTKSELQVVITS